MEAELFSLDNRVWGFEQRSSRYPATLNSIWPLLVVGHDLMLVAFKQVVERLLVQKLHFLYHSLAICPEEDITSFDVYLRKGHWYLCPAMICCQKVQHRTECDKNVHKLLNSDTWWDSKWCRHCVKERLSVTFLNKPIDLMICWWSSVSFQLITRFTSTPSTEKKGIL